MNKFVSPSSVASESVNGFANGPAGAASDSPRYEDFERMAASPAGQQLIDTEFQAALEGSGDGFSRRRWMQLMGASLALGAAGCRYPSSQITPYAFRPVGRDPGVPVQYASAIDFNGVATPIRATSYDGRPIKLDGNRLHPDSMGASDVFTQASILELYDPDRLRHPVKASGGAFVDETREGAVGALRAILSKSDLKGVAILSEPSSSPTMARLQKNFETRGGRWFTWSSINDDNTRAGSKAAFGRSVRTHYDLDKCEVIVSLEADLLGLDPAGVGNSRRFAAGRDADHSKMSRLYVVESDFSLTGASADHRLGVRSGAVADFAVALAAEIKNRKKGDEVDRSLPYRQRVLAAMAQDLVDHAGAGAIAVGERQPAEVHALAHKLNSELGNHGKTVRFTDLPDADRMASLESAVTLQGGLETGEFKSLIIVGGNPVYDFPANVDLAKAMKALSSVIHLTVYKNETSLLSSLVVDVAHPLEAWGDGRSWDGTWCIAQPLIAPLFGAKSTIELLASGMSDKDAGGLELVGETAAEGTGGNEAKWNQSVHDGYVAETAAKPVDVGIGEVKGPAGGGDWNAEWNGSTVELVFAPSRSVFDGRFANNGWLQELPDFITKVAWDNAALVGPHTAEKLKLKQNKIANFKVGGVTLKLPVHVTPGQAEGSVSVELGYGRKAAGRVGGDEKSGIDSVGVHVGPARNLNSWHFHKDVKVSGSGTTHTLASVQEIWTTDKTGRDEIQRRMFLDKSNGNRSSLVREGSYESFQEFLKAHPAGEHDHDHAAGEEHADLKSRTTMLPVIGSIPLTLVSHDQPATGKIQAADSHDKKLHGGHAEPQWPDGFAVHHETVDLTPGVSVKSYNPNNDNKWGMSIDLNSCTGCSSCVTACQAENNIPIVGRWQVWRGREMQWLRIDRYFGENLYNKEAAESGEYQIVHQPVTCHHCENAPCETVCPVAATVHSDEGLNDMVYNRCIGTRYCGNNCPYKVRRFNYLNYSDAVTLLKYPGADKLSAEDRGLQNLMMNPEVTIRSRGVMEKCTYCVQRIQNTKILAKNQHRKIGPNEITTACQDACPTGAIRFGDLLNKESDVAKAHANPRSYVMLEDLNNRPRTRYLARVRNPHPALVDWDDRGIRGVSAATAGTSATAH